MKNNKQIEEIKKSKKYKDLENVLCLTCDEAVEDLNSMLEDFEKKIREDVVNKTIELIEHNTKTLKYENKAQEDIIFSLGISKIINQLK